MNLAPPPDDARVVLRPWVRRWVTGVLVEVVLLGAVSVVRPDWYRSSAYDFARDIAPLETWGIVWTAIGVAMGVALIYGARVVLLLRVALSVHGLVQVVWGASILALTFSGFHGAFAGWMQWAGIGAVSFAFAAQPLTVHRRALEAATAETPAAG